MSLSVVLDHIHKNDLTVCNHATPEMFHQIWNTLHQHHKVVVTSQGTLASSPDQWGTYVQAMQKLLTVRKFPDVCIIAHTNSMYHRDELYYLIHVWESLSRPCRLVLCTQSTRDDYIELAADRTPKTFYERLDRPDQLEELLEQKIRYVRQIYHQPEDRIVVVSPSPSYFRLDEEGVVEVTEADAPYILSSVLIDTCLRTVTYRSVGSGFRQVEDIATGQNLQPIRDTSSSPVYFLLSESSARKESCALSPYRGDVISTLYPHRSKLSESVRNLFRPSLFPFLRDPFHHSNLRCVGPLGQAYLRDHTPKMADAVLLTALDTLQIQVFQEDLPDETFSDSLDFFTYIWNRFVEYKGDFSKWVETHRWNSTMMIEWWNTLQTFMKDEKIRRYWRPIKAKEVTQVRSRLRPLLYMYERRTEDSVQLGFQNMEKDAEDELYLKNDWGVWSSFESLFSIGPLTLKEDVIQSFMIWN